MISPKGSLKGNIYNKCKIDAKLKSIFKYIPPHIQNMKEVNPSTLEQTITADENFDGLQGVIIKPVTSDIDENIQPNNIRTGKRILGVDGNLEPDKPDQNKTAIPSRERQVIRADQGYELAQVEIEPIDNNLIDTRDADAEPINIRSGKTAYVNGEKKTGTLPVLSYPINPNDPSDYSYQFQAANNTLKRVTRDNINYILGEYQIATSSQPDSWMFEGNRKMKMGFEESQIAELVQLKPEILKIGNTILGVEGEYEGGGSAPIIGDGIKLFSSISAMEDSENNNEGDIALVYKNDENIINLNSEFQIVKFPQVVIVSSEIGSSENIRIRFESVIDPSVYIRSNGYLRRTSMEFTFYPTTGNSYRIRYRSTDGITYTRQSNADSGDFESIVKVMENSTDERIFDFFVVTDAKFRGIYLYKNNEWILAPTQLTAEVNDLLPNKIAYGKNGVIIGTDAIYDNLDPIKLRKKVLNSDMKELTFNGKTYQIPVLNSNIFCSNVYNETKYLKECIEDERCDYIIATLDGEYTIDDFPDVLELYPEASINEINYFEGIDRFILRLQNNNDYILILTDVNGHIIDKVETNFDLKLERDVNMGYGGSEYYDNNFLIYYNRKQTYENGKYIYNCNYYSVTKNNINKINLPNDFNCYKITYSNDGFAFFCNRETIDSSTNTARTRLYAYNSNTNTLITICDLTYVYYSGLGIYYGGLYKIYNLQNKFYITANLQDFKGLNVSTKGYDRRYSLNKNSNELILESNIAITDLNKIKPDYHGDVAYVSTCSFEDSNYIYSITNSNKINKNTLEETSINVKAIYKNEEMPYYKGNMWFDYYFDSSTGYYKIKDFYNIQYDSSCDSYILELDKYYSPIKIIKPIIYSNNELKIMESLYKPQNNKFSLYKYNEGKCYVMNKILCQECNNNEMYEYMVIDNTCGLHNSNQLESNYSIVFRNF